MGIIDAKNPQEDLEVRKYVDIRKVDEFIRVYNRPLYFTLQVDGMPDKLMKDLEILMSFRSYALDWRASNNKDIRFCRVDIAEGIMGIDVEFENNIRREKLEMYNKVRELYV